jgi:hypothetical protein
MYFITLSVLFLLQYFRIVHWTCLRISNQIYMLPENRQKKSTDRSFDDFLEAAKCVQIDIT